MLKIRFNDLVDYGSRSLDGRERRLVGSYPELLRSILDSGLTKTQKCYIMLYYRDGLKMTEIAERYGVNKATVSRTIHRARERIRKLIGCEILRRSLENKTEEEE